MKISVDEATRSNLCVSSSVFYRVNAATVTALDFAKKQTWGRGFRFFLCSRIQHIVLFLVCFSVQDH